MKNMKNPILAPQANRQPANPEWGWSGIFPKEDGHWYIINSNGEIVKILDDNHDIEMNNNDIYIHTVRAKYIDLDVNGSVYFPRLDEIYIADDIFHDDIFHDESLQDIIRGCIEEMLVPTTTYSMSLDTDYRCKILSEIHLIFPEEHIIKPYYISSLSFISGETPTTMSYAETIYWSGDDITDGTFLPQPNKAYDVMFYVNTIGLNGIVRGVAYEA
jgi:hypothetical protein